MQTWEFIYGKKSSSIDVVLLYVLESSGSSPGRQGFNMAVAADGEFCGTIGGGIMEHKFVEKAKAELAGRTQNSNVYRQIHNKLVPKNQSGMICSGEQTVFLYHIQGKDISEINFLLSSLRKNKNGALHLSCSGIIFSDELPLLDYHFEKKGDDFLLIEKTGYKNYLHIIGGGHCSLALSRLMKEIDFFIHVYEIRDELNTMQQNTYAHRKTILRSYSDLADLISGGNNIYIVIMTLGYRSDDEAIKAVIGKKIKYLGVLGSKTKAKKLIDEYQKENGNQKLLNRIYSPAGIQIKSRTAAEIAVSIVAEIISVKNQDQ